MITHSVFFKLKHAPGSAAEREFFEKSEPLESLPSVQNFVRLKQTSKKNDFTHGFSMQFSDQAAYDAYNVHPVHSAYVRDVWIPHVADFMEIDYVAL